MRKLTLLAFAAISALAIIPTRTQAGPVLSASIRDVPIETREQRTGVAGILDSRRHRLVTFGGTLNGVHNDVRIVFLGPQQTWRTAQTFGTPPPAREEGFAVYDSLRDRMLLFLPDAGDGVWSLSLAEPMTWTALHPSGTQPVLRAGAAVYDPVADRILGFGGKDAQGGIVSSTWALALAPSPAWSNSIIVGVAPPARAGHLAAYDATNRRMLVCGGFSESTASMQYRIDTYELRLDPVPSWSLVPAVGDLPPTSRGPAMGYDPARQRILVFGGVAYTYTSLDTTFVLDLTSSPARWSRFRQATGPVRRDGAFSVYDTAFDEFVMMDGDPAGIRYAETWSLAPGPDPGWWFRRTQDGGRPDQILSVDGEDRTRGTIFTNLGDWELELGDTMRWRFRRSSSSPSTDEIKGSAYDPTRHQVLALALDRLYVRSLDDLDAWTPYPITGGPPLERESFDILYADLARDRLLAYGGEEIRPDHTTVHHADLWAVSLGKSPVWQQQAYNSSMGHRRWAPPVRDARRDRLIEFGGCVGGGYLIPCQQSNESWEIPLPNPNPLPMYPLGALPPPQSKFASAYDSTRDRMTIFSGSPLPAGMWALQFDDASPSGHWWPVKITSGAVPRLDQLIAFTDPVTGVIRAPVEDRVWFVEYGPDDSTRVVAACPGGVTYERGTVVQLPLSFTHHGYSNTTYRWTLSSERDWPLFPMTGTVAAESDVVTSLSVGVAIPDTAALGTNRLRFLVEGIADAANADSCAFTLGVADPIGAPHVDLSCSGDRPCERGQTHVSVVYAAVSDSKATEIAYDVISERSWPGFPKSGTSPIVDGQASFTFLTLVPDTVAVGSNAITITASLPGDGGASDTCVFHFVPHSPDPDGPTSVIGPIFPNPAGTSTTLRVELARPSTVRATVRRLTTGQVVLTHDYGALATGPITLPLPLDEALPPGAYTIRIEADGQVTERKLMLVR